MCSCIIDPTLRTQAAEPSQPGVLNNAKFRREHRPDSEAEAPASGACRWCETHHRCCMYYCSIIRCTPINKHISLVLGRLNTLFQTTGIVRLFSNTFIFGVRLWSPESVWTHRSRVFERISGTLRPVSASLRGSSFFHQSIGNRRRLGDVSANLFAGTAGSLSSGRLVQV